MNYVKEIKSTITETYEVKDRNYNHTSRISAFFMVLVLLSCQSPSGHKSQSTSTSDTTNTTTTRDDQEISCDQISPKWYMQGLERQIWNGYTEKFPLLIT